MKPRTAKQIAASRANGSKSKGPVTPKGKLNSAGTNLRHGFLAKVVVLSSEPNPIFLNILENLTAEHQPATETENHPY